MRCNLCAKGWIGTVSLTNKFSKNGVPYFTETDIFYLGGSQLGSSDILAEWTASGSGTYLIPGGGSLRWTLSADVAGQCAPLGQAACVTIGTGGKFVETNTAFTKPPRAFQLTQTNSAGMSSTSPSGVSETQLQTITPANPSMSLSTSNPVGQWLSTNCMQKPPQNPGGYTCTSQWTWSLSQQ